MRVISKQSGQAMVFVYFFIGVVIIGLLVLFNTGQLTRQKMEVQNAADAAAYSAALLSARYMNYVAYTNRAMVANEVAIGQFGAFNSWANRYKMAAESKTSSIIALNAFGLTAPVGSALASFFKVLNTIYSVTAAPMSQFFGRLFTNLNYYLNHILGLSQQLMRMAIMEQQWSIVDDVVKKNAPGATLSNFGALAVIFSQVEQFLSFSRYTVSAGDYDERIAEGCDQDDYGTYDAEIQKVKDTGIGKRFCSGEDVAKRRYVAIVNDSKDPWMKDRRSELNGRPNVQYSSGYEFKIAAEENVFGSEVASLEIFSNYSVGLKTRGGTSLRFLDDSLENTRDDLRTNTSVEHSGSVGWSHMDTVVIGASEAPNLGGKACILGFCAGFSISGLLSAIRDVIEEIDVDEVSDLLLPLLDLERLLNLHMGGASAENAGDDALSKDVIKWVDAGMIKLYGDAWNTTTDSLVQPVAAIEAVLVGGQKKENYRGIAPFTSVDPFFYGAPSLESGVLKSAPLKGPAFIVGVRKNIDTLRTSEYTITKSQTSPTSSTPAVITANTNRFNLTTWGAGGGNNIEDNVSEASGQYADKQAKEYAERELTKLTDKYSQPPPEFDYLPAPIKSVILDVVSPLQDAIDGVVGKVSGAVGDVVGKLVEKGLEELAADNSNKRAIYALASARIVYTNPGKPDKDPGSAFGPYWEARLVPVDEDVKKWAVYTQDNKLLNDLGTALTANNPRDMDKNGVKNHLKKLGTVVHLEVEE